MTQGSGEREATKGRDDGWERWSVKRKAEGRGSASETWRAPCSCREPLWPRLAVAARPGPEGSGTDFLSWK